MTLRNLIRAARKGARRLFDERLRARVNDILEHETAPDTTRAESSFEALQRLYPRREGYHYDTLSLFERASTRVMLVAEHEPRLAEQSLSCLEVGGGDGMLGSLLCALGHECILCDISDWRCNAARSVPFVIADSSTGLPIRSATFDLAKSFNTFEHVDDPKTTFEEMLRTLKPGGKIYLSFGPLYCAPWGQHAYRTLNMPYPQFLFSDTFLSEKLSELGIFDLGRSLEEPQSLNRWKADEFESLWRRPDVTILSSKRHYDGSHLATITQFPESFQGRGLTFEDITCNALEVTLMKH